MVIVVKLVPPITSRRSPNKGHFFLSFRKQYAYFKQETGVLIKNFLEKENVRRDRKCRTLREKRKLNYLHN